MPGYVTISALDALVELFEQFVKVVAVHEYCLFDGLAVSHCAAYAVHAYCAQNICAVGVELKTIYY